MAIHLKFLQPLKILIPNWNFFDRIDALPALRFRTKDQNDAWTEWKSLPPPPPRHALHLFLNPQGNLHLYLQNQVERLLLEASEQETDAGIVELPSYQLILKRLRVDLLDGTALQFKMVDLSQNNADLFLSQEHTRVS